MQSSPSRTESAVAWASIETFLRQGVQFGSGIVLARLLTPADFGLVAMLAIFMALGANVVDSGFASALIHQQEESNTDSSTVFWFNIASGTVIALILGACAPLIARFYSQPQLVPIAWAMALNLWISSWMTVHVALLTKHMNFKVQAQVSGISNLIGALIAIVSAIHGAGIWALVVQSLVTTFLNVIVIWWLHPWRPSATFSTRSLRKLFNFGGFMLASAVVYTVSTRLYSLLIGRLYTDNDLGQYSRAITTCDASQTILGTIFTRVAFPVLARHGKDPVALKKRLKSANQLTMSINLPAMIGMSMVADVAIPTIFGHQWDGSIPLLQILCLAGAWWPLQLSNVQVMLAQGNSSKMFRFGVLKNSILVASMLVASPWGLPAIAWSTVFSALISFLLYAHSSRLIGYGPLKQLRDLIPYLVLTGAMVCVVALVKTEFSWLTSGKRLVVEVLSGFIFYVGVAAMLRLPALAYALEVVRSFRSKKTI